MNNSEKKGSVYLHPNFCSVVKNAGGRRERKITKWFNLRSVPSIFVIPLNSQHVISEFFPKHKSTGIRFWAWAISHPNFNAFML